MILRFISSSTRKVKAIWFKMLAAVGSVAVAVSVSVSVSGSVAVPEPVHQVVVSYAMV
jgi:uncharacterized membrane protein